VHSVDADQQDMLATEARALLIIAVSIALAISIALAVVSGIGL
jgi:cation transport ATPase